LPWDHFKQHGPRISDNELFESLLLVNNELGHEPCQAEYISRGKFSECPFKRFGKNWKEILIHYRKWKTKKGNRLSALNGTAISALEVHSIDRPTTIDIRRVTPAQFYGEPIDFRGLRHAPINEQGVVYLFGMVSRELGFYIESVKQGFPDCEGKYLHDSKRNLWAKARIEFEFRPSSFRQHGHDAAQCDFIVCWINDWPDCPITVIELSKEILKLAPR
jgi:hypothetical protein